MCITCLPVFPCLAVTSLRKAEKAAAIKIKREEVDALRKALEKSSRQSKPNLTAPISGGMFGLTDAPQGDDVSDLSSGPPSFRRSARSYRQQEPPRATVDRSSSLAEALKTCDGDVEQIKPKSDADPKSIATATAPSSVELPAPRAGLSDQLPQGGRKSPDSRSSSGARSQLRPPAADVSPPLSARTPERKPEWRRRSPEEGGETAGKMGKGEVVAIGASKRREHTPPAPGREDRARVEPAGRVAEHADQDEGQDEAVFSDNPLLR